MNSPLNRQLLNLDPDMLERMETDLHTQAAAILQAQGIQVRSTGIYSLDEMETLTEASVGRDVCIGAGYEMAAPLELEANAKTSASPGQAGAARMVGYYFSVIVAVPTEECCGTRFNGMQILTALRFGLHGSPVAGDAAARRWNFQREKAETTASTATLLYYSQLWMVALPLIRQPV
jgi:hypothetical protein